MNTYEQLRNDLKQSMLQKDSKTTLALRMIISSIRNKEIEIGSSLKEEDVISVLRSESKKVLDSIEQYSSAGREDLVSKEKFDLSIIEKYLPSLLDESSTKMLVKEAISSSNACGIKDMGKVMGILMSQHKNELDGNITNSIVKEELSKL